MAPSMVARLLSLSNELLSNIACLLPGSDIKSLRLCNQRLNSIATPFLHPIRSTLDIFVAVAKHPQFNRFVQEVILEDVCIVNPCDDEICFGDLPDAVTDASRDFYDTLKEDYEAIMERSEDMATLRMGLKQLPNLKRITLAIEPYWDDENGEEYPRVDLNNPRSFRTPLLRLLPEGVSLPMIIPRLRWNENHPGEWVYLDPWSKARKQFRVLCAALEVMVQSKHQVKEFVVQRFHYSSGISHRMFTRQCFDTQNATIAFSRLYKLDLALDVRFAEEQGWMCFRSGVLREVLAAATELRQLTLRTNLGSILDIPLGDPDVIKLSDVLTPESWPLLQQLELENWLVDASDLEAFLPRLPVALSFLRLEVRFKGFKGFHGNTGWKEINERVVIPFAQSRTSLLVVAKEACWSS